MGLSDEERIAKIYFGIERLIAVLDQLDDHAAKLRDLPLTTGEQLTKLRAKVATLWDCFLGQQSNGAYWLLGGDLENEVKDGQGGPWAAAICQLCQTHRKDGSVTLEELREKGQAAAKARGEEALFDPFEEGQLSVEGLLRAAPGGSFRAAVYSIYGWTEHLVYALRRYDDDLLQQHQRLSKCIADIQGICYSVFVHDEVYARAYVLHRVLRGIYGDMHGTDKDPVYRIFNKVIMHHDFTWPMTRGSLTECIAWDRELLQAAKKEQFAPPGFRLWLAVRIAGEKFHYVHKQKDLLKWAQQFLDPEEFTAYTTKIQEAFTAARQAHETHEGESITRFRRREKWEADYAIHGYSWKDEDDARRTGPVSDNRSDAVQPARQPTHRPSSGTKKHRSRKDSRRRATPRDAGDRGGGS